jgi:predicted ATPase/class 3 adenylate cyclase
MCDSVQVSAGVPPSGVVTFLFTDIEGSTRRWESDAASMRGALSAHDEVLGAAIGAHGGYLFKHTGDGVCAAFASPRSAVDAAVAAQQDLQLPVRMGIATGEADLRDGDYLGTVLNRVARLVAAGHGGQILVAESTACLLSGVKLMDLGSRRLRDVSIPVTVFQVQASGLRQDFPPLRTVDTTPGNVRPQATRLIGRESESADIDAALQAHRVVTLTGVGGVGKTRLALEVAAQLVTEYPDGVWVFELAAVVDTAAVPDAVAAVLGITQQPGKTMTESIAAASEGRVRLLLFDNCEHVLDAVSDVIGEICAQSSAVRILATSREGLGVADEQVWPVSPLYIDAAVELFVERAASVAPGFTADRSTEVREICQRLDGIPLAIELAASRVSSMTVHEINGRLDDRFKLLVGSRRGLARHQTLRHTVGWSFDLLAGPERHLLQRMSVFAGGFDLQGACAVADFGNDDEYRILDMLDALVRKSLMVADRSAARTRYSMLETVREFAEEQLMVGGSADDARIAHARYFAGRQADIMALWDGARQRESYDWFMTELPNLRSAFRWAADHDDVDTAAAISMLAGFLGMCVENYEATAWAEEIIDRAEAVGHPYLGYLYVIASLCYFTGRIDDGVRYGDAGYAALRAGGWEAPLPLGSIQCNLGGAYLAIGRPDLWVDLCQAELDLRRDTHSFARSSLAMALATANRPDEAIAATAGLIDTLATQQNPYTVSYALLAYGYVWRDTDPPAALEALRRGLRVAHDNGVSANESILAMTLGRVEADHGDSSAALDCIRLAIRNYRDSGNVAVISVPLANLAVLLHRCGFYDAAATILGYAHTPMTTATIPELDDVIAHLRGLLGSGTYEALASKGREMTTSAIVTYAYDQIDHVRARLERSP